MALIKSHMSAGLINDVQAAVNLQSLKPRAAHMLKQLQKLALNEICGDKHMAVYLHNKVRTSKVGIAKIYPHIFREVVKYL